MGDSLVWIGVWVVRRMQDDMKFSAGGESFKMRYVWQSLKDVKTWVVSRSFVSDFLRLVVPDY